MSTPDNFLARLPIGILEIFLDCCTMKDVSALSQTDHLLYDYIYGNDCAYFHRRSRRLLTPEGFKHATTLIDFSKKWTPTPPNIVLGRGIELCILQDFVQSFFELALINIKRGLRNEIHCLNVKPLGLPPSDWKGPWPEPMDDLLELGFSATERARIERAFFRAELFIMLRSLVFANAEPPSTSPMFTENGPPEMILAPFKHTLEPWELEEVLTALQLVYVPAAFQPQPRMLEMVTRCIHHKRMMAFMAGGQPWEHGPEKYQQEWRRQYCSHAAGVTDYIIIRGLKHQSDSKETDWSPDVGFAGDNQHATGPNLAWCWFSDQFPTLPQLPVDNIPHGALLATTNPHFDWRELSLLSYSYRNAGPYCFAVMVYRAWGWVFWDRIGVGRLRMSDLAADRKCLGVAELYSGNLKHQDVRRYLWEKLSHLEIPECLYFLYHNRLWIDRQRGG